MIEGHGGNIVAMAAALGCSPEEIVDMSSNINPLGTMPGLLEHLAGTLTQVSHLPEADSAQASAAIAALLQVAPERVLAGAGTTQFIYTACKALASSRVLIVGPTYADYTDGCRIHGIEPDFFLTRAEADFAPDIEQLTKRLAAYDTVFLCNPNNPTGHLIPQDQLVRLCLEHPQTRFIVDESYLPFAVGDEAASLCRARLNNVLTLWSVSKIFGIPGLRAGFLVARPELIAAFHRLMPPWRLNSLAQEAVCFLGANRQAAESFITRTQAYLAKEDNFFREILQGTELTIYPSATSYFLIRLPRTWTAEDICAYLAEKHFLIRNCANFYGLDERFIRIALKDPASNATMTRHLLAALSL